jgi:hypothetical protein
MLADCDAGNAVTAAQSGAQWGLQPGGAAGPHPLLYMVQEFTVRPGFSPGEVTAIHSLELWSTMGTYIGISDWSLPSSVPW